MNKTLTFLALILLSLYGMNAQENKSITIGDFGLEVPEELSLLSKTEREQKYAIQGHIPDEVYQTENDDVNVSYMATLVPIEETKFPVLKNNLEKQFTNPNSEVLQSDIIELDGKKFILTKVMLKVNSILMANLVTEKQGKMVMLIVSHSMNRANYLKENEQIINSLKLGNVGNVPN